MATRRQKCRWCGVKLLVPVQAQASRCPYCHSMNEFRHDQNGDYYPVNGNLHRASNNVYSTNGNGMSFPNYNITASWSPDYVPPTGSSRTGYLQSYQMPMQLLPLTFMGKDELDDEALCPLDYEIEGKMLDDEINATIVRPLPLGATLHAIIDTCFSGTFLDLPFMCRMNRKGYYLLEDHRIPNAAYKGTEGGMAISISACDDHQNSGDTTIFTGTATGALTYSFIQILERKQPRLTYGYLLSTMRNNIHKAQNGLRSRTVAMDSVQEPQLSSSQQFDIHSKQLIL